jgi:hypothetical protein
MVEGSCVSVGDLLAREEMVLFMWESLDNSTIFISLGRVEPLNMEPSLNKKKKASSYERVWQCGYGCFSNSFSCRNTCQ